jgi:hypothetical protein
LLYAYAYMSLVAEKYCDSPNLRAIGYGSG